MKNIIIGILAVFSVSLVALAETIVLKSGRTIEGKIVERTGEYVRIDVEGVKVTYFNDEIEKIEEVDSITKSVSTPSEQTIEAIINEIEAKVKAINTAKQELVVTTTLPQGIAKTEMEMLIKEDKARVKQVVSFGDKQYDVLMITNNKICYINNFLGNGFLKIDLVRLKEAGIPEKYVYPTAEDIFNPLSELDKSTLEYIGSEELNGKLMYVIEGKRQEMIRKLSPSIDLERSRLWIDKENGLVYKKISFDVFGNEVSILEVKEAQINISIPDDIFLVPSDISIVDNTELTIQTFKRAMQN